MEQLDDIMKEFLVESYENLDQLGEDLLALEQAPDDSSRIASIFRTIHTIKGTSGFLALPRLERLTHVGENLLVPLRDGALDLNCDIPEGLLNMVDAVRDLLNTIETTGSEGEADHSDLIQQLEQLKDGPRIPAPAEEAPPAESVAAPEAESQPSESEETAPAPEASAESESEPSPEAPEAEEQAEATTEPQGEAEEITADVPASDKSSDPQPPSNQQVNEAPAPAPVKAEAEAAHPAPTAPAKPAKPTDAAKSETSGSGPSHSLADTTLRIDVQLLDSLMNLVGELVLSRNQVLQFNSSSDDAAVNAALQKLNLVTTELQEAVMKTRMQPIRNAWSKLPRVARDLANSCGRKVNVQMEGADTELDKTVLEAIKDPLTHIVRNSVDHGIESPEDRVAKGKPATGTLLLRAFHEGGQVNIEIVDDGRGLDLDRIRAKALEKGLVSEEQAASMNDREVVNLVLLPGFSTAAKVTNISGRGVGMDVVKTNIERIGGTLDIQSVPHQGTTLRIKLPLTLAIVPALVVSSCGQNFAIPQVNLLELVRLDPERAEREIEYVYDTPVYRLRGNLLPLLYLDRLLGLKESEEEKDEHAAVNIVVLQADDRQYGLVVDGITDTQEIVVKPLDQYLKGIKTYAGATIMGNGSVSLILDTFGLALRGGILSENEALRSEEQRFNQDSSGLTKTWLVVDPGDGTQAAVALEQVARLEEFPFNKIERIDNRNVVQYRGHIMPLIDWKGHAAYIEPNSDSSDTQVVVYNQDGKNIGLVVNRIVDIVKEKTAQSTEEDSSDQYVIGGKVTKIITSKMMAGAMASLMN